MVKSCFPQFKLIELDRRVGIGEALNIGLMHARGEYLVLDLNSDDLVSENWLKELVEVMRRSQKIGVVGGKRYLGDSDKIDSAGGRYSLGITFAIGRGSKDDAKRHSHICEVDYVPVLLTRRSVIERIGLLDTHYSIYGEDADFCLRAKAAGYKVLYVPKATLRHQRSTTVGEGTPNRLYFLVRSRLRLMTKLLPYHNLLPILIVHILFFSPFYFLYYAKKGRAKPLQYLRSIRDAFKDFFSNFRDHMSARRGILRSAKLAPSR